jgi:primosomal protein N' (replication factor Y) (superfamily II helicase)
MPAPAIPAVLPPSDGPLLRVALPVPLPREFDYLPPPGAVPDRTWIGRRVRVPFAHGEQVGVITALDAPSADSPDLKTALAVLDEAPVLAGELLGSLRWLAHYTHAPLGEVLATALPGVLRAGQPLPETRAYAWRLTEAGTTARGSQRAGSRPRRLADLLADGPISEDRLEAAVDDWRSAMRALGRRDLVERVAMSAAEPVHADPDAPTANDEQRAALDNLAAGRGFRALLLEGVTGSGKTEVYLQAIRDCVLAGKQALVLVPEIGLTPQTLARFRARLGVPVHATHSGLADGARARAWTAMARGEGRVLVGTRSAIFTPLPEAGLIVIDEEHDGSYKQQDGIRYHARDFALVRAKALGIPVLLGSATPSLESLHNAIAGRYTHLRLTQRAGGAKPPRVRVLDVRKRLLTHGLSQDLLDGIAACLARGEQALVFKNRRGYAPALLCHDCGWSASCKRCDAPMTLHAGARRLDCHHCGARAARPPACPDCGGLSLQPQGFGTERLEEALAARFPDTPLIRVDRETTRHRDAIEKHLAALGDGPGILVGTQMLAKGHDLPRLTLVAVVGVDEGLYSADFRAGERLSQLLIQVAGRAGRANLPGEVLLQTHHPDHPLLLTLLGGGYPAVAALELAQREAAGFPPYEFLALLRAEAPTEEAVTAFLHDAKTAALAAGVASVVANGPMPAPMARRAGRARGQLLLSAPQRPALQAALSAWVPAWYALKSARRVRWSLDVDPIDLY